MRDGHAADGKDRSSTRWGLLWSLGLYGLYAASVAGACLCFFLAYVPGRRAAAVKEWKQELVVRADLHKMALDDWGAVGLAEADILAVYPTPGVLTPRRMAPPPPHRPLRQPRTIERRYW